MRQLTTRFFTSKVAKFEKATGKSIMDLLDIGNLEINKLAVIIKLGNTFGPGVDEDEEAYKILDTYLASDEEHSIISALFDLIDEMDRDLKILKSCGLRVSDIKEQFKAEVDKKVNNTGLTDTEVLVEKAAESNIVNLPVNE